MVSHYKDLMKRISQKILDGEDPEKISLELNVNMADVLLAAFDLQNSNPQRDKPFDEKYSNFIRACLEYSVPSEEIADALEIKIRKSKNSRLENISSSSNEDPTSFEKLPDEFALYANRITSYSGICANYREFSILLDLWENRDYKTIMRLNKIHTQGDGPESSKASVPLYRLASKILSDIDAYTDRLKSEPDLLRRFKEQVDEMKESTRSFLTVVSTRFSRK